MSAARRLVVLTAALSLFRLASAVVVSQPGYTDAYYYADVAKRLASGQGLTADFVWNFLEAPGFAALPVASHRFWMPLASGLQAVGIAGLPFLDAFRAAQAMEILVALCIPVVAYAAARSLDASPDTALVSAAVAGLGGALAPGWVSLDAFAPAALIGTAFFIFYRRAALGDVRFGAASGAAVGLLFLARAEGALFGLALLALLWAPRARRAGAIGSAFALCIGLGWFARDLALGATPDLLARSALLVRYEDFFAVSAPTFDRFAAAMPAAVGLKLGALGTNLGTFLVAFGLLLVPGLARGVWRRPHRPEVAAFGALLVIVYLAESLVWTLHSTRGSYFHSIAAFFPYGCALGVLGTSEWLRASATRRVAAAAGLAGAAIVSVFAVAQWDAAFNAPYNARLSALERIAPGPFAAIDAAAWRWIAGRPVIVTPADDRSFGCALARYGVRSVVLEQAHFSEYDALYAGTRTISYLGPPTVVGELKIFPVHLVQLLQGDPDCAAGQ